MISIIFFKVFNFAAAASCTLPGKNTNQFFGFPHWWQYLKGEVDPLGKCSPVVDFPTGLWAIVFAIIDMLLYLAGLVAVVMIIIAGISYITSQGSIEKAVSARKRLVNSIIGLIIVVIASAVVSYIGKTVG
jgi:hypothetical protein